MALKTYEKQLLEQTENSNVQQARLVSASLSGENLDVEKAKNLLLNMNGRFDARIRILDKNASLVADSAVLLNQDENDDSKINDFDIDDRSQVQDSSAKIGFQNESSPKRKLKLSKTLQKSFETTDEKKYLSKPNDDKNPNDVFESPNRHDDKAASETFVYKLFSVPVRIYRKYFKPPVLLSSSEDYYSVHSSFDGDEIKSALDGKYGAATRISSGGQVSVNLYSAVPIVNHQNSEDKNVIGVVLVSRSTYKILQNLYELRLDLGKIFLWSLLAVALIAIFLTFRISLPLRKLSCESKNCADKKGRVLTTKFTGEKRHDEIGELSRSFTSLVEKLNQRIKFAESFASDVSHEFKNPLAAIRSCTEFLSDSDLQEDERNQFVSAINEEVLHLQNLLTEVRNITKINGNAENEKQNVNLRQFAENIVKRERLAFPKVEFSTETKSFGETETVLINENYLDRLSENLLSNAASFGTKVIFRIHLADKNDKVEKNLEICVEDNGKGVQDEEKDKIFERFYSNRPDDEKSSHTGLGLATVKAIVDSFEGEIKVERSGVLGGAKFVVELRV